SRQRCWSPGRRPAWSPRSCSPSQSPLPWPPPRPLAAEPAQKLLRAERGGRAPRFGARRRRQPRPAGTRLRLLLVPRVLGVSCIPAKLGGAALVGIAEQDDVVVARWKVEQAKQRQRELVQPQQVHEFFALIDISEE